MKNAIVKIGAKQYRVTTGDVIQVEKIDAKPGDEIKIDQVLLLEEKEVSIGKPFLKDIFIEAEILEHKKDTKIKVFKRKRRKNYRRTIGHRQNITLITIKGLKKAKA